MAEKQAKWIAELQYLADCDTDGKEWGVIDNGRVAAYLLRQGYATRLPQYHHIKAYQITRAGAEAISRLGDWMMQRRPPDTPASSAAPEAARADAPAIPLAGSDGWELMEVSEVEALREENAKLLKSEQAYYERNEALEKELETRERDNGKLISSLRPFYKAYAAASEDAQRIMDEMPLTFDEWAISYIAQHEAMRKELESAEDTIRVLKKRAADALSEGE